MQVQSYLFFDGRCEEAIEFYRGALGARPGQLTRYKESPEPTQIPPGSADKVMHASVRIGETEVMMSDGHCTGAPEFKGFGLTITAKDGAEAQRLFGALSNGGKVQMPLAKTFFAEHFGMVTDKFGVMWMVIAGM
jgi:PhnB protein